MGNPKGYVGGPPTKGNIEELLVTKKVYAPSKKHDVGGWGTPNPIKSTKEGNKLLNSGISYGKRVYNVTGDGKIVVFMPDNTPQNGYHSYEVTKHSEIPSSVLKEMYKLEKIDRKFYMKVIRNKIGGSNNGSNK